MTAISKRTVSFVWRMTEKGRYRAVASFESRHSLAVLLALPIGAWRSLLSPYPEFLD
jgi:hypothetical protein